MEDSFTLDTSVEIDDISEDKVWSSSSSSLFCVSLTLLLDSKPDDITYLIISL